MNIEGLSYALNDVLKTKNIRKILMIVEQDQLESLPKSPSLKNQVKILEYIYGKQFFNHVLIFVGHPFDEKYIGVVKR